MKKIFSILLLVGNLLFAQIQGPKIFIPLDFYDFGTIKQGEIVKHSFPIVNKGDDTLKILSVITSCGCTAFDLPKKEIIPGETVQLLIEFNSSGKVGVQNKMISITSNDKDQSQYRLTLKGTVSEEKYEKPVNLNVPKIDLPETQHDFGVTQEGKMLEYSFKFKNIGQQDLEIKDIKTSCGCTAALASSKLLKPGEEGTIKVDFDTANRFGKSNRTISITTNEPETPIKVLTIYAEITKREN